MNWVTKSFHQIYGAGKSTHLAYVADLLRAAGRNVVLTREPGGTPLGEKLRELILHEPMHIETETLLVFAARREHLAQLIEPALARGDWVISDRFTDATFAYQGGGRGLPVERLDTLEQWVHPHLQPDLTLLFDVPLEVARARLDAAREPDRFERERAEFFAATRSAYLRRAGQFPGRFRRIDSSRPVAAIQEELRAVVEALCAQS